MTFLYKILDDVPAPPQSIIDGVDRNRRPTQMEVGYYHERALKNWYGYNFNAGRNVRVAYPEFEAWVKENISIHITDCGINYVNYNEPTGGPISTGAHTDGTREYVMLWDIELGGPDAELTYWQARGQSLYRPPKSQGEDLSELIFVDKIRLPRGKWTVVDTRVLHSVENLYSTRMTLHISFLNKLALETVPGVGDLSRFR